MENYLHFTAIIVFFGESDKPGIKNAGSDYEFTPAAESHGLWPWVNARTFGRDVAPHGR